MLLLEYTYGPLAGMNPGLLGLEDCEGPFANLKTKQMIAE